MMESYGFRFSAAAENIAKQRTRGHELVDNSAGHRANILSRSVTQIGWARQGTPTGPFTGPQLLLKPL